MAVDVGGLILCNLLFLVGGAGLVRFLGGWRTLRGLGRTIGVCYLAGVAAFGVTMQLWLVLGGPFNRWVVIGVCAAFALSGLLARNPDDPVRIETAVPRYLVPVVVVLVGVVVLMAVDLWFQPLAAWDAWAQWTAKARALAIFGGLERDVFVSSAYRPWNADYPLLLPSVEAADFTFMRSLNSKAIPIQSWFIYAGALLALIQLLRGRAREALVWPLVLGLALAPSLHFQTATSIADVPVAVFFAVAGIFAWRWLAEADAVALRLFALFGAAALATKFEGRMTIGALSATLLVLVAVARRSQLRATIVAVLASLLGLVPMMVWASQNKVIGVFSTSVTGQIDRETPSRLSEVPTILETLAVDVLDPARWLVAGIVVVAALAVGLQTLGREPEPWLVVGTLSLATVGLILAYVASPLGVEGHLAGSSSRVITGPVIFAVALVPLLLEAVLAERARRSDPTKYALRP